MSLVRVQVPEQNPDFYRGFFYEMVSVSIYDLNGRMVTSLSNGVQSAGYHSVTWNASEMPTGLYFVKLVAGSYRETQKIMLIK